MNRRPIITSDPSPELLQSASIVFYQVSKSEIEGLKFDRLLKFLKILEGRKDKGFASLLITFSGYDDIPDEVYEIKAIRNWVQKLFRDQAPHILYFINAKEDGFGSLIPSLGDVNAVHQSEKLSTDEYLRRGINPLKDIPKVLVTVKVPTAMCIRVVTSLEAYGKRIKDPDNARTAINVFKAIANYGHFG